MPAPAFPLLIAVFQGATGQALPPGAWDVIAILPGTPAKTITWKSKPTNAEVTAMLPKGFSGMGFTHVSCRAFAPDGALLHCRVPDNGFRPPSPFTADPAIDALGLAVAERLRADLGIANRRQPEGAIHLAFRFDAGDRSTAIRGFCLPFCSPHF